MATPVTQYSSPDPSLSGLADFQQFVQYLITGTNYIIDNAAQVVYEFNLSQPGVLKQTNASYAEFQAFLLANPVTSVLPNPQVGAEGSFGFPYNFQSVPAAPSNVYDQSLRLLMQEMVQELRAVRLAVVELATQGGLAKSQDFDPQKYPSFESLNQPQWQ